MRKLRTVPPSVTGERPCGRSPTCRALLLDPPLVDVVDGRVWRGAEVLQRLLRHRKDVVLVAEVVRLILVEDLVEGLVLLLARGSRAVAVRRVASLFDRLVHRRVLEVGEAKAFHLLGRV